jgi:long-chain acyl-CoA synthetase
MKKKNMSYETRKFLIENRRRVREERKALDIFVKKHKSMADYFDERIPAYSDMLAITDEHSNVSYTYAQLMDFSINFAAALQSFGLNKGEFVSLFSENNGRWLLVDQAISKCGAVSVDRGVQSPVEELDYILSHSDSVGVIFQDLSIYKKVKPCLQNKNLKFIILMYGDSEDEGVYSFDNIIEIGKNSSYVKPEILPSDGCAMLYTSGTTGMPKGVLLTHYNILSQMSSVDNGLYVEPGETSLHILPVWHAYERTIQYYYIMSGAHLYFTTVPNLKKDLINYQVDRFTTVPRVWESLRVGIYQKIKQESLIKYYLFDFSVQLSIFYMIHKMYSERRLPNKVKYSQLSRMYHKVIRSFIKPLHFLALNTLYKQIRKERGLDFKACMSGGGSLSIKDQLFYDAIGVNLREGYGLTETSPVISLRSIKDKNYLGCTGKPVRGTEFKICDVETGEDLGLFRKGLVKVRGPQIMKEYYKNPEATASAIDNKGWFTTGDLGWLTGDNNLVIVGRVKETIVLSNGENVEPIPIEEACLGSPYIEQIVLVGQDMSSIGALVVPSNEALTKCGLLAKDLKSNKNLTINNPTLRDLIKREINTYIKNKTNLKSFEKIKQFEVLNESFNVDNGMVSQTSKIKRNVVFEKYRNLISKMFGEKK